jgi:hypothetical protein
MLASCPRRLRRIAILPSRSLAAASIALISA